MAEAVWTIDELLRLTGMRPSLFNLRRKEDFNAIISEQAEIITSVVRRTVGDEIWNTTDKDRRNTLKMALANEILANVMMNVADQRVTGTQSPLIMGDPEAIERMAMGRSQRASVLLMAAQTDSPTDEAEAMGQSFVVSTTPIFRMDDRDGGSRW
jgi:hypothetical protein